jgi:hypothetical protein
MLFFKNVPVVIEPGVAALEVAVCRKTKDGERLFYVPFSRVNTDATIAEKLPFIVSSSHPHIFSMAEDIDASPFLLIYDYLGKLYNVYTRELKNGAWTENKTVPEQIGETVTQFSVRFSFNSIKSRDKFLGAFNSLVNHYQENNKNANAIRKDVETVVQLLLASNVGPVVLPIAVAKPKKSLGV